MFLFKKILYVSIFGLTLQSLLASAHVQLGERRELFVDDFLVERLEGAAQRVFHHPVPREIVMTFDKPWEGDTVGFISVLKDGELYRMWYRASDSSRDYSAYAYAQSKDGIHWVRPVLGMVEFAGCKENNLIFSGPDSPGPSDFAVFKDDNPDTHPDALYKAVGLKMGPGAWTEAVKKLGVSQSPDGLHWTRIDTANLLNDGFFDSQNVAFWDPNISAYRAYYRISAQVIITRNGKGFPGHWGRNILTATTKDFTSWSPPGKLLQYTPEPHAQFYTNVIRPYHRAPHLYIGMPMMYEDRGRDEQKHLTAAAALLPDFDKRLALSKRFNRYSPQSEIHLMWSRDGESFELAPSAFITPGPERPDSWTYADAVAWHIVETDSVFEGASPELTFYKTERYFFNNVQLRRFTLRLDGFASIHAPIAGGEFITRPFVFEGSMLSMNFASSAYGSLRVEIQNVDGTPIPGFTLADSIELYGDTVARNAMWKEDPDLGAIAGQPVRLRFVMRDVHLYSIKFDKEG